jgi:hypothetical protein
VFDGSSRFSHFAVFLPVYLLVFERFHKRFTGGIIGRITSPAHAEAGPMIAQQAGVLD